MAKAEPRGRRLDQPRQPRGVRPPSIDSEAFGRASESIARFFGTATFLIVQSGIVVVWLSINGYLTYEHFHLHEGPAPFDKYPFILLNLAFSTQAAYAAPLILLAQNRQADRDRISLEEDRARTARTVADTEFLAREIASVRLSLGEVVTRDFLRSELRSLLEEEPEAGKKDKKPKKRRTADRPVATATPAAPPADLTEPAWTPLVDPDSSEPAPDTAGSDADTQDPDPDVETATGLAEDPPQG